jgi:hypothetical protein
MYQVSNIYTNQQIIKIMEMENKQYKIINGNKKINSTSNRYSSIIKINKQITQPTKTSQ